MLQTLSGIVLSLVPERYRARYAWASVSAHSAIICGFVQIVVCLGIAVYRYILFADRRVFGMPEKVTLGAMEKGGETALMGMGLFVLMEYLLQPLTVLLVYFVIEGLARASAATITGEIVPTLPLQLVAWIHFRAARAKHERDLGPPVEDIVQRGAGDFALTIASCRPKPWTNMITIAYEDQLYELVREDQAQPPRRWVYCLRKRPESKVIRGEIYQYRPDENLPKEPQTADTSLAN